MSNKTKYKGYLIKCYKLRGSKNSKRTKIDDDIVEQEPQYRFRIYRSGGRKFSSNHPLAWSRYKTIEEAQSAIDYFKSVRGKKDGLKLAHFVKESCNI